MRWVASLDPEERARAEAFHFPEDRRAFIAAHALLRHLIACDTERKAAAITYDVGPYGKPALRGGGPEFNLSHTRGMVVVALSPGGAVGVDVEATQRRAQSDLGIARENFCREEVEHLTAISDPCAQQSAFLRLWTRKEAYLKATGQGLHLELDRFSVLQDDIPKIEALPAATLRSRMVDAFHVSVAVLCPLNVQAKFRWTTLAPDAVLP